MQTLSNWYVSPEEVLLIGYPDDEPSSVVLNLETLMNHKDNEFKQGSVLIFPDRVYKLGRPYRRTSSRLEDLGIDPNWVSMVRGYVVEADNEEVVDPVWV